MSRSSNKARKRLALVLVAVVALVASWTKLKPSAADAPSLPASAAGAPLAVPTRAPTKAPPSVPSTEQPRGKVPAGNVPMGQAPFDVAKVVEQVQSSFETTKEGFRGGRATYGVRASEDGIALEARHWERTGRSDASPNQKRVGRGANARATQEKPLESRELVLRTTYVGRSAASASGTFADDIPALKDAARVVAWQRDNHTEHLRQTPEGVEQSWEFASKPSGRGDLSVRVHVSGLKYQGETPNGLHFADARGLGFRYGHGTWVDAAGVKTAVNAHFVHGAIELSVPQDVVERSAYPAVLDPIVGPEFELDAASGPAYGEQTDPQVAWNGSGYLLVWEDTRGGVFAARVTSAGQLLDPSGKKLGEGARPSVSSNGNDYLVAWETSAYVDAALTYDIRAARVDAAGTLLDTQGVTLSGARWQRAPAVTWNGSDYVVVWRDYGLVPGVYLNRVSTAGEVLDGVGVAVSSSEGDPVVASKGSESLIVWQSGADVYARRLNAAGAFSDAVPFLVTQSGGGAIPRVASNGDGYLVLWSESAGQKALRASRVSAVGVVEDSEGVQVAAAVTDVAVASLGGEYLVVWSSSDNPELRSRIVDASGQLSVEERVLAGTNGGPVSLASNDVGYFLTWPSSVSLSIGSLSKAGEILDKSDSVITSKVGQLEPSVASNGTDFLVVWLDYREDVASLRASRVSAAGTVLDAGGIAVHTGGSETPPSVASNGSGYLIAWDSGPILAKRLGADGTVLDAVPLVIGNGDEHPQVASNGVDYFVIWRMESLEFLGLEDGDPIERWVPEVYGRRVPASGPLEDPVSAQITSFWYPRIASSGTEYLVTWGTGGGIGARMVGLKGELLGDPVWVTNDWGAEPDVASNGAEYVLAWCGTYRENADAQGCDIHAARVTKAGVVVDSTAVFVSDNANHGAAPRISSNGHDYLVVWKERQAGSDAYDDGELRGATLAFEPFPQVSELSLGALVPGMTETPLTSLGGRYLMAYGGMTDYVPRVRLRLLGADCSSEPAGDADGDAVCDGEDNCLGVSNFGQEDADGDLLGNACDGCPRDATKTTDGDGDGDGALDCNDGCPTHHDKSTPGQCGCGAPDTDSDGDGTADCVDQCPSDPEKVTDFDLDVDGTLNCNDGCPTNPSKVSAGVCGCNASDADADDDGMADCLDPCPSDEQDACVEPGEGGAGGGGDSGSGSGDSGPDVNHAADDSSEDGSGCGCRTAGGSAGSMSGLLVFLAGVGLIASRRRLRAA